jgi:hypothetical protein
MYTYIHTYIHTHIHTYTHTYMHTYMHTYIHIYIHTCIHTHIHTYVKLYALHLHLSYCFGLINIFIKLVPKAYKICFLVFCATAPSGPGPPHSRGFQITHNYAPQSVGLLWTSDQLVAETCTWQHTTLTTDKLPCPGGIRTHNPSRRAAAVLQLDRTSTGTSKTYRICP